MIFQCTLKKIFALAFLLVVLLSFIRCTNSQDKRVQLHIDASEPISNYAYKKLSSTLSQYGYEINDTAPQGIFILDPGNIREQELLPLQISNEIKGDGYRIRRLERDVYVIANTQKGRLYGVIDLAGQLANINDLSEVAEVCIDPAISFRAIKFNLPWSPYRPGPATDLHMEQCRDLAFWESFLDMTVSNKFNALTLWNAHPFPYMIRSKNYPKATPFSDAELSDWKDFWKKLFFMAKERGIETYIVNWNIVVSPEFAEAYGANVHFDRSELVKKYTRESVTQVIDEYDDLTGIGVTLADWMGNWGEEKMTPTEREDWIQDTFVEGMKAADRKVKFIHRAVLAGDPQEMRRVIDYADLPDKTIVEVKFNWSHGHSTPRLSLTHSNDAGTIMREFWDPHPENYFIAWMIRNEDFFVLPWGDPEFIRAHIKTNHHDYVDGYFVGSEGYIPAVDYSSIDFEGKNWKYAFQKQWMFYYLWGRLLFNPEESDDELSGMIQHKYPEVDALRLLEAYSTASNVPQSIASFYKGTWDFTLYSEGFLAPWQNGFDDGKSPFISLEELINHETLDQKYLSIKEYCHSIKNEQKIDENKITPLQLADQINEFCVGLDLILTDLRTNAEDKSLLWELDDLATWCQLGFYFADKIRAGVYFENYRLFSDPTNKEASIMHLKKCIEHWEKIIHLTEERYKPMPYVSMGHHEQKWPDFKEFHWKQFLVDVKADLEFVQNYN